MADDTLNYRVNVDASSLANQLQQIKNQIDTAMATYTFNATIPDPYPRSYGLPSAQFGAAVDQGIGVAQAQAASFMESSRLGFQKFAFDVQNAMLATRVGGSPLPLSQAGLSDAFGGMGPLRRGFEAATGFSYNPRMSMTYGRYLEMAGERLSDVTPSLIGMSIEAGVGAMGGGAAMAGALGLTGTAAGLAATGGALAIPMAASTAFMSTFGYDINAAFNARAFTRDTSWRFASGKFTNTQAGSLGVSIAGLGGVAENVGFGVSQGDAMGMVQQFTEMGGFDTVRTAQEFRDRARGLATSVRQLVEITGATQKEVLGILKQTMDMGILPNNLGGATTLGLGMTAQAFRAGYTANEFAAFGAQGAEMVRGTGIMMGAGFLGIQQNLFDVRGQMTTGLMTPDLLAQLGGEQNLSATRTRMGFNFGMSSAGLMFQLGGGPGVGGGTIDQVFTRGLGKINSDMDYYAAIGAQARRTGEIGAGANYGQMSQYYMGQFQYMNPGITNLTEDVFTGFLKKQDPNITDPVARDIYRTATDQMRGGPMTRTGQLLSTTNQMSYQSTADPTRVIIDAAENSARNILGVEDTARMTVGIGNLVGIAGIEIQRAYRGGAVSMGILGGLTAAFPLLGVFTAPGTSWSWSNYIMAHGAREQELSAITLRKDTNISMATLTGTDLNVDSLQTRLRTTQNTIDARFSDIANLSMAMPHGGYDDHARGIAVASEYNALGPEKTRQAYEDRLVSALGYDRGRAKEMSITFTERAKTLSEFLNPNMAKETLARTIDSPHARAITNAYLEQVLGISVNINADDPKSNWRGQYAEVFRKLPSQNLLTLSLMGGQITTTSNVESTVITPQEQQQISAMRVAEQTTATLAGMNLTPLTADVGQRTLASNSSMAVSMENINQTLMAVAGNRQRLHVVMHDQAEKISGQ